MKGDLVASLQGRLATEKQKDRHEEYSKLHSVGRLFHEPIWVFTRGDLPIKTLRDLKGKRILIGTRESGARGIARQLLKANGVVHPEPRPSSTTISRPCRPLVSGTAEAAIIVLAADTEKIQKLLLVPNIRLMDFAQEADTYTTRFPALSKVVLRQGAVDLDTLIPSEDITLLSTSVALVVRPDMQPALVSCSPTPLSTTPNRVSTRAAIRSCSIARASFRPPTIRSSRFPTPPASSTSRASCRSS